MSITTPSAKLHQARSEFLLNRAAAQSSIAARAGLIQAGVYRSGPRIQLDNCGATDGTYKKFSERLRKGSATDYKCKLYGKSKPGQTLLYTVDSIGSKGRWRVFIGSANGGTFSLGFNMGNPYIGGELQRAAKGLPKSQARTRYGSTSAWSIFTKPNRGGPQTVTGLTTTALLLPTDKRWRVPVPPTPLTITH